MDKEPPKTMGCPDNIERNLVKGEKAKVVFWIEPQFYDNVGVRSVFKSRDPGSEFGIGKHHVTYVASDEAGNRGFCHFTVNIKDELLEPEETNSINHLPIYANHNTAGKYRAVLICPSGVHYMAKPPDSYNNLITREAGCYWRHVKVPDGQEESQSQIFNSHHQIPRHFSESRLPFNARSNRRVFFKWSR
ncbi:unnamed protein product [Callosobruchus maculatus]|uniref:HYR domain-containing protein n=1 Tax=Callosobruchus maculatus TaxID=64391 RepID=A0A653BZK6_CALMS|nr:unnamed protein product [Callosobruchus maculatus]